MVVGRNVIGRRMSTKLPPCSTLSKTDRNNMRPSACSVAEQNETKRKREREREREREMPKFSSETPNHFCRLQEDEHR